MKFWKRWISDFRAKTRGCSLAEVGAYDTLLDEYYALEGPLPNDLPTLYRICGAMDLGERKAIDAVVARYFPVGADGLLHNERCDEYLATELGKNAAQADRGRLGAAARWGKPDPDSGEVKPRKPRGNGVDHEAKPTLELPDWVPVEAWAGWLEVRARVRAPNTPRALRLALAELERLRAAGHAPDAILATATIRGWRGLFAPTVATGPGAPVTAAPERDICITCHEPIMGSSTGPPGNAECSTCWSARYATTP